MVGLFWVQLGPGGSDWSKVGQVGPCWVRCGPGGSGWVLVVQIGPWWVRVAYWQGYRVRAMDRLWCGCPHTSYDTEGTAVNGKVWRSADKNRERQSRVILSPSILQLTLVTSQPIAMALADMVFG